MHILFITPYFPPETGAGPHLSYDLAVWLARRGHQVSVLTGNPVYHVTAGEQARGSQGLPPGLGLFRTWLPASRPDRLFWRGLGQIGMAVKLAAASARLSSHDVALIYCPPIFLGLSGWFLSLVRGLPYVLGVQDLFPQSAIDLGLLRNATLIALLQRVERFAYHKAGHITVPSKGTKENVVAGGADPAKVTVIPHWVDTADIVPGPRQNNFRRDHGLDDKFIVSFAGVLGFSQDVDVVLEAAGLTRSQPEVAWVIAGDGAEQARIQEKATALRLENLTLVPMLPRAEYRELLAASDLCLSTLRPEVATPVVPSKIGSIMAAGRPLVAAVNPASDAARLVEKAGCGVVVAAGDARALAFAVLRIQEDPGLAARMGEAGRCYAEQNLALDVALEKFEAVLQDTVNSWKNS